jgi:hypothetical protein
MRRAHTIGWGVAAALAVAALPIALPVQAADPSQFSVAEKRLFVDDHLRGLRGPATLEYTYAKRGSLEAGVDDTARVIVGPASAGAGPSVRVEYLTETRKLELADIDAAHANPVILFFLERDVREMHRLTGGSVSYYRKRIRMALAEGGQVEAVTRNLGSRRIAAVEIHVAPYRDDPARSRYEKFADKTYTFTLSDDVPGTVVELRSELSAPRGASGTAPEIVIAESLRFVRERR